MVETANSLFPGLMRWADERLGGGLGECVAYGNYVCVMLNMDLNRSLVRVVNTSCNHISCGLSYKALIISLTKTFVF